MAEGITPCPRFPQVAVCATISAPKTAQCGLQHPGGSWDADCVESPSKLGAARTSCAASTWQGAAGMDGNASFGYWVRRQRKALDLAQAELARRVGCAEGTIRMIEADARRPSRQIAARLAEQLAIAPADHSAFIRAARAELSVDRLAPPAQHASHAPSPTAPDLPGGTVTFFFTHIEGSTALWEQHPQTMPVALARHTAILRAAIA